MRINPVSFCQYRKLSYNLLFRIKAGNTKLAASLFMPSDFVAVIPGLLFLTAS
uniref:Transmembrane protein 230 isoform X1 n=1 Tax=Rhizophora mucronata TaxID=61149 RepID=A0A2P2J6T3_RHIMU